MTRIPGAHGRRPPKNHPAIAFAPIAAALDPVPATYEPIKGTQSWLILGNDSAGDCVAVTWATFRRIMSFLTGWDTYPTIDEVWAIYRTQNPDFDPNGTQDDNGPSSSADQGMDIQTLLEYLVKTGGPDDVKAVAFAKVDHTNLDEIRSALYHFQALWLGVNVTDTDEREFSAGKPWTPTGHVLGGHSITGIGYTADDIDMQTWAEESALSNAFMVDGTNSKPGVEEAWVVVWPEHIAGLSTDAIAALAGEYQAVTGEPLVVPITPDPTPDPPGDLGSEIVAEIRHAMHALVKRIENLFN